MILTFIQTTAEIPGLSSSGVLFWIISWTIVISITGYCFYKVIKTGHKMN